MTRQLLLLAVVGAAVGCTTSTRTAAPTLPADTTTLPTVSASPTPRATPTIASRSRRSLPSRRSEGHRSGPHGTGTGSLTSTAFCETGLMADGQRTRVGAVAANRWPLGTRLRVSDSPYGPGVFEVADRYGWGTQLDFATPGDCALVRAWGRRTVRVEVAESDR